MAIKNKLAVAREAMRTLHHDRENSLLRIDAYERGDQDLPYTPDSADAEYKQLAKRSITNVLSYLILGPGQMLAVDSFRRGRASDHAVESRVLRKATDPVQPEWDHWQGSGLDAKQTAVTNGALKFGHSFVLTETDKKRKKVLSKGLSALNTVALYEDPANDEDPYVALTVTAWPSKKNDSQGKARMWDDTYEYAVTFKTLSDSESVRVKLVGKHGASTCPVTRFAASLDLEGRTVGVVEPMMVLQDRINQTIFDLLIVQSYASFKVRTISGMAPPIKLKAVDIDGNTIENPSAVPEEDIAEWVPVIDPATGRPVPDEINLNAKRLLFAEDHETRFGTLDETPLAGFIEAIQLAFRHMAALSQTPPHFVLGEIANVSADALTAAETSLIRKVGEFKRQFGESWERVFRVAAELNGEAGAEDFSGEVIWRDMGTSSLAQAGDALGKLAQNLGIPVRGLWGRVPNVTANELAEWNDLYVTEQPGVKPTSAGTSTRPSFRLPADSSTPDAQQQGATAA